MFTTCSKMAELLVLALTDPVVQCMSHLQYENYYHAFKDSY